MQPENFIACMVCLNRDNTTRVPAVTVANGYSVCQEHIVLVSRADFNIHHLTRKGRTT